MGPGVGLHSFSFLSKAPRPKTTTPKLAPPTSTSGSHGRARADRRAPSVEAVSLGWGSLRHKDWVECTSCGRWRNVPEAVVAQVRTNKSARTLFFRVRRGGKVGD